MPLNHWFWKRRNLEMGILLSIKNKMAAKYKQKLKFSNFETIIIIGHVFRVGIGQKT